MNIACVRCGGEMILGHLEASSIEFSGLVPKFVIRSGVPTSVNPISAIIQGIRNKPAYRESSWPIRSRACTRCGVIEYCLSPEDTIQVEREAGYASPAETDVGPR